MQKFKVKSSFHSLQTLIAPISFRRHLGPFSFLLKIVCFDVYYHPLKFYPRLKSPCMCIAVDKVHVPGHYGTQYFIPQVFIW